MFVKYFTSLTFDRKKFAYLLTCEGVRCAAVVDGVILDLETFKRTLCNPWAEANRRDILSEYHTRPATLKEYEQARGERYAVTTRPFRPFTQSYTIYTTNDKAQAEAVARAWPDLTGWTAYITDRDAAYTYFSATPKRNNSNTEGGA